MWGRSSLCKAPLQNVSTLPKYRVCAGVSIDPMVWHQIRFKEAVCWWSMRPILTSLTHYWLPLFISSRHMRLDNQITRLPHQSNFEDWKWDCIRRVHLYHLSITINGAYLVIMAVPSRYLILLIIVHPSIVSWSFGGYLLFKHLTLAVY